MVPQNNTGTAVGADSYVSYTYAGAYLAKRISLASYTDEVVLQALYDAFLLLESSFTFNGQKLAGETQPTQFPRYEGETAPETSEIPDAMKKAQCEVAIFFLTDSIAMVETSPEDYFGDKYAQADNALKTYIQGVETELNNGKKHVPMSEKYMYDAGLLVLTT